MNAVLALGQLIAELAVIAAKAYADRNADHAKILADADMAVARFRAAVGALETSTAGARAATDAAIRAAEVRITVAPGTVAGGGPAAAPREDLVTGAGPLPPEGSE